jgi:hypothetical protein
MCEACGLHAWESIPKSDVCSHCYHCVECAADDDEECEECTHAEATP